MISRRSFASRTDRDLQPLVNPASLQRRERESDGRIFKVQIVISAYVTLLGEQPQISRIHFQMARFLVPDAIQGDMVQLEHITEFDPGAKDRFPEALPAQGYVNNKR